MNESSARYARNRFCWRRRRSFWKRVFSTPPCANIVKTAGVTTGALYGYYDSKEALVRRAGAGDAMNTPWGEFQGSAVQRLRRCPSSSQPESLGAGQPADCMQEMLLYMHEHRDDVPFAAAAVPTVRDTPRWWMKLVALEVDGYAPLLHGAGSAGCAHAPRGRARWSICWSRACSTPILRSLSTTCR